MTTNPFAAPEPGSGRPEGAPSYGTPPGYGPPPYPPTGYGRPPYGAPVSAPTNGLAIASLVLGVLWLGWIGSVLALVFGYVAKGQIRERGEAGDGLATAGIVLGWIGVGFFALVVLLGVAGTLAPGFG